MDFKKNVYIVAAFILSISMINPLPVIAKEGDGAQEAAVVAVAAAAILGVAALSHHDGHYPDGVRYENSSDKAEFERGYRDGLHNSARNNYNNTKAYRHGYKSGFDERDIRISHNQRNKWDKNRHAATGKVKRVALKEAERFWNIPRGSATPLSSTYNEKNGHYRVDVAAGYHRGVCVLTEDGTIVRFKDSRQ
ncbi:hypothetical protein OO185_01365 [Prosthecochloris sp. SCSIO W1102]|uniref:hypothetical protein n=1 Tax=Prosthecochloris sp. SCSIO W1102 TaxID=2992243 RepID=UPI00223D2548|nr:hypothetical protein [Prosthecochloris sp. SCSIO W1102]UZJ39770.1 hypothetical protein OO185_01365 [Prosthecochloris sp. SCSIO W1102]